MVYVTHTRIVYLFLNIISMIYVIPPLSLSLSRKQNNEKIFTGSEVAMSSEIKNTVLAS